MDNIYKCYTTKFIKDNNSENQKNEIKVERG